MLYRWTVCDVFGAPLRAFETKQQALLFMRNKKDCTLHETTLEEICGEALF